MKPNNCFGCIFLIMSTDPVHPYYCNNPQIMLENDSIEPVVLYAPQNPNDCPYKMEHEMP